MYFIVNIVKNDIMLNCEKLHENSKTLGKFIYCKKKNVLIAL